MAKKYDDSIKLSLEHRSKLKEKLKHYIDETFDTDIGLLQADMFVDFLEKEIGNFFYNKAIEDSIKYMTEKADDLYLLLKDER